MEKMIARLEPVPPDPVAVEASPWGAKMTYKAGPYASLPPTKLLDLFEQESYYSRVDGSAGMIMYTQLRKEILKRLTSTYEA